MLVDNIEEVAGRDWDNLSKYIFTKDTVYEVNSTPRHPQSNWIAIKKTNDGQTTHGWDYKRWQLVNTENDTKKDIAEMYKALGMEALDE